MTTKSVLPATWENVPEVFQQRLGEKAGRQRAMSADGHLLLVLHRPPKKNEPHRQARLLWRKPDGTWQASDGASGPAALGRHLAEFGEVLERYDRQEDNAQSVADLFGILEGVSPLSRSIRNLHATLQDAREKVPDDRDLINFRDRAYELERTADLLVGDVRNALEFATAKKAEEQAAHTHQMAVAAHRLNLLAAFFFPIATLSAVFGSGLAHPLERLLPPPLAFFAVLLAGLTLGIGLLLFLLGMSSQPTNSRPR
ncbi:MAG: hypothetical protein SFU86_13475 [Pirellulaceae bacterium]|nr:hypothetical protein [Pirellulaceae bacterium]